jgi:predicted dehydrogenase
MAERIRVGVVGANAEGQGWAPLSHLPALRHLADTFEIVALCTSRPESAAAAAKRHGVERAYHDVATMVREADPDLVSVVVRVPQHRAVLVPALEAGKHVYCEWPLGVNLAEAEELAALARRHGVKALVGLQARGDPTLRYLHQLVRDGYLGELVAVNMTMFTGGVLERPRARMWEGARDSGVSALTVRGIHTLDALCWCLGELVEVSARATTQVRRWRDTDSGRLVDVDAVDNVVVNGVLEGGGLVSAHIGMVPYHASGWRLEMYGRDGTLRVTSNGAPQRDANRLAGGRRGAALEPLPVPAHFSEMPDDTPAGPPRNVGHLYLRMARAMRDDTPVAPDFDLAVWRHRLIDAVQRSSDEGRPVRLD